MNNVGTAYVLWLGCLLQLYGLQRLYNGKIFTGLLWMFSFGLFGFGQLIDLILIPNMVDEHNQKLRAKQGLLPSGATLIQPQVQEVVRREMPEMTEPGRLPHDRLMVQLLKAAETKGGKLSVAQGVIETGASFADVEMAIRSMVKAGYVEMSHEPTRSVVIPDSKPASNQLTVQLLKAAETRGGKLSVTQGVMETGASFKEVEETLKQMVRAGYVDVDNHPETGVVLYEFRELS
ncbi:NINE protein [Kovacikia minuta CCNUW1]|uniref:NINE protein n=1 Tax=Kovacikia minuta TaxID=2931930 RepID=UPI001CCE0666|nr:NINE protein [Kovacikia minuta]UBF29453.1 NINE protein [Kovacikia minuta CCNUW1]